MIPSTARIDSLESFFRYTSENPYVVILNQQKWQKIYQNCLSCNQKRVHLQEITKIFKQTNLGFCDSCYQKLNKIFEKYCSSDQKNEQLVKIEWEEKLKKYSYYHAKL